MKKINFILLILSIIFILLVLLVGVSPLFPEAAPSKVLHVPWDQLLKKHVKDGRVDYKGFLADKALLNGYLEALYQTDLTAFDGGDRLAFWINAYNAYTIKLMVDNYPLKSIRDLRRPWKRNFCRVAGQTISLDTIEHEILRKEFNEPRIHFAIVCASIGCPDLQAHAYEGGKISDQLQAAAEQFFASSKHIKVEWEDTRAAIYISKIFKWFGDDFGRSKKDRIAFILRYLDEATAEKIRKADLVKLKYLGYDWNLNEKTK